MLKARKAAAAAAFAMPVVLGVVAGIPSAPTASAGVGPALPNGCAPDGTATSPASSTTTAPISGPTPGPTATAKPAPTAPTGVPTAPGETPRPTSSGTQAPPTKAPTAAPTGAPAPTATAAPTAPTAPTAATHAATTAPTTPPPPAATPTKPAPTWWAPWTWQQPAAPAAYRVSGTSPTAPTAEPTAAGRTTATATPTEGSQTSSPAASGAQPAAATDLPACPAAPRLAATDHREAVWHLSADSSTMYWLTYNGVVTVQTAAGPVRALDFTASSADLVSMDTWADGPAAGERVQNNAGAGKTTHLTGVHLHVTRLSGKMFGLIPSTLTPDSPPPLIPGVPTPIPVLFTGVTQDNLELDADTLTVPGYNVHAAF